METKDSFYTNEQASLASFSELTKSQVVEIQSEARLQPAPFLKWAGGKSQLLRQFDELYPARFVDYYEPFLGGGAVFFELYSLGKIKRAHLNDANADLMNLWAAVKLKLDQLEAELERLRKETDDSDSYYKNRREFNSIALPTNALEDPHVRKAALFVYLNKTCFNGLYRVNAGGEFNVPFGRYVRPRLFSHQLLRAVSKALQDDGRVELTSVDFEAAVEGARKGDFVYFDPPYQPLSATASFTAYTATGFGKEQQDRLSRCFKRLDKRGCYAMLSNSSSGGALNALYKEYFDERTVETVKAARAISSKGKTRGAIDELVIMNYRPRKRHQKSLGEF